MGRWTGRLNRPVLWLVVALVAAILGTMLALESVRAFARPADPAGVPRCDRDFADDCITLRDAVRPAEHTKRGDRANGVEIWRFVVAGDWPGGDGSRLELTLRDQDGIGELREGVRVELVFVGAEVHWVRLPSGDVLETDEHPWQAGPSAGVMALMGLGVAVWTAEIAVRSARRRRSWVRAGPAETRSVVGAVLFAAGLIGAVAQLAYPRPAPLLFLALALLGGYGWFAARGKSRRAEPAGDLNGLVSVGRVDWLGLRGWVLDRRRRAVVAADLDRLVGAGRPAGEDRRNGRLAVVVRPSAPRGWQLDPGRVAAAAQNALATRGWVDAAPDLTADGWFRDGDGVRLTRGVVSGRVHEDGLLEVTARDDGVILLACGRGTSHVTEAWPRVGGGDPAQESPVVLPALALGLTQAALLLAAELSVDHRPGLWSAGVRIDRLRGAVARELLLIGADAVPLDRDEYVLTVQVSDTRLRADAGGVSRHLVGPLFRELGVEGHYGTS